MNPILVKTTTFVLALCLASTGAMIFLTGEALADDNYTLAGETVNKGSSINPTYRNAEDAQFNQLMEGDQYSDTNFSGTTENVVIGTAGGGSFPSSLDTDDATRRSYTEVDTGGGGSVYYVYLMPNGDNSVNWDLVFPSTPTTHYDKVDEQGAVDGDTTYVRTSTASDVDIFNMADMSEPASGYNIDVTTFAVHKKDATQPADFQAGIRIGTTNYIGIVINPTNGVWVNTSATTRTINPATSAEWTWSEVNALMTVITTSDATPNVYCTKVGIMITVTIPATTNYKLDVNIVYSSVTSTAQTTGFYVYCQGYRSNAENYLVYAWDYTGLSWTLKTTVQAASDTDYNFNLLSTERDSGANEVKLRVIGNAETGDTTQDIVYFDILKVCRIETGYASSVELTSTTVAEHGNITLRLKGYTSSETWQIDVWNYTSSAYDTNKLQVTSLSNAWQTTIDLCDDHHRSGANVKIRLIDTVAETGDTTQDTFYLDVAWVTLEYTDPVISAYTSYNIEISEGENAIVWCTYTDYDNQAPAYMRVHVDVSNYAMDANDSDTDYFDGKLYGKSISGLSVGVWDYWFATDDAESSEVTTPVLYTITVTAPENAPPEFTSSPAATGHNNTLYYYDANADDDDEDPLTFDLEGSIEAWASINPSTGVVQGTPTEIGDYWMNVSVTDGTATVWQNTSVHIYTDSPSFVTSPITTWQNGTTYQYNAQASDPEAEGLSFDLEGNGTSFVGITPAGYYCMVEGDITEMGWWYLNLSVTDGTNTIWQNWTLTALNSAPYFTFEPILTGTVNESYACPISATDNNSDDLIYSIDASSIETLAWLTLNLTSMQLEGISEVNGSFDVNLSVTDTVGAVSWSNFTITIELGTEGINLLTFILAVIFCFGFLMAGFKDRMFLLIAGPCWIICGMFVFNVYGDFFTIMALGLGAALFIKGAYDVWH